MSKAAIVNSDEEKYANESFEEDVRDASGTESDSDNENVPTKIPSATLHAYARNRFSGRSSFNSRDLVPYESSSEDENDVVVSHTIAEINTEAMYLDELEYTPRTNNAKSPTLPCEQPMKDRMRTHHEAKQKPLAPTVSTVLELPEDSNQDVPNYRRAYKAQRVNDEALDNVYNNYAGGHEIDDDVQDNENAANGIASDDDNADYDNEEDAEYAVEEESDYNDEDAYDGENNDQDNDADDVEYENDNYASDYEKEAVEEVDKFEERRERDMRTRMEQFSIDQRPPKRADVCADDVFHNRAPSRSQHNRTQMLQFAPQPRKEHLNQKVVRYTGARNDDGVYDRDSEASETENDEGDYQPKMEVRFSSHTPSSFNSEDYAYHLNFVKPSTLNSKTRFPTARKSWSFSNDRMREIERHNEILLRKILTQKPAVSTNSPYQPPKKFKETPPSARMTTAAINRRKMQRQIDIDNLGLKRRIEAISHRRSSNFQNF